MSREKQIDEIAKLICTYPQCTNYNVIGGCKIADCQTVDVAERLYNTGYRKQSEVAKEIFEEIEKCIASMEYTANTPRKTVKVEEMKEQVDWALHTVIPQALDKIKKKYTEEQT